MTVLLLVPLPVFAVGGGALRDRRASALSLLGFAFLVIWNVAHGHGPFVAASPLEAALPIQLFLTLLAAPMLLLAALVQERRLMECALAERESQYRSIVESTGDGVLVTDLANSVVRGESRLLRDHRLQRGAAAAASPARVPAPRRSAALRLLPGADRDRRCRHARASCASARTAA